MLHLHLPGLASPNADRVINVTSADRPAAQTVDDALALLEEVATARGATLSELARATGMTTSKAYRPLGTLEQRSYLERRSGKAFELGPKLLHLGHRAARYGPQLSWPHDARLPLHSCALGLYLLAYVAKHSYAQGVNSVASPILGTDRVAVAALSVVGAVARLDAATEVRMRAEVRDAAADVARYLT